MMGGARHVLAAVFYLVFFAFAGALSAQDAQRVFESPATNSGLGPVPDRINRNTPRAAMASFLLAGNDGDWRAAALEDRTGRPVFPKAVAATPD